MLGVNDNRFIIGKDIYYPFAVELHYFRVDKRYWSICFERIKKAGFRILSTPVPWNLHQGANKDIDFTGFSDSRKDLIVFLELAREFGFKVILRPGPWIAGQWPTGGLPKFLFSDLKILARDSKGQEIPLPEDYGVAGGYLPSYLHPHFQHFLHTYFKTFIETTKNYIYPRGPVFMVELDYETSFGRYLDPSSADYNPDVLSKHYSAFLSDRYEDIKKLNQQYRIKASDFESVEPPRDFSNLDLKEFPHAFDWFRFREYMLRTYLSTLEELFKSYTVEPLFFRSLYFQPGDLLPSFSLVSKDTEAMLGTNVFPEGTYFDLAQKGRYLDGEYSFAWASAFTSGKAATERELKAGLPDYPVGLRRFYLVAGLASGFRGINHYMFVDRDHWHGAPLESDGTITDGYEVIKEFNSAILNSKHYEMERITRVCIIGNRQYQWLKYLKNPKQFDYVNELVSGSLNGFCRDLMRLKLDYVIRETLVPEELKKYDLVFIATAEFMSEEMQEGIVELLKLGVNVILCGLLPKYDDNFRDCQILSRHLRIKTSLGCGIDLVKSKTSQFSTRHFGHVLSTDNKVKKLAWVSKKTVGVASSKYKGTLYLFTFDTGSNGDHNKLTFIESVLADSDIAPFYYCSDPSVDIVMHKADKRAVMYILAPPPGELSTITDTAKRDVVIRVDLRKVGISSAKVKVTDLLAGEEAEKLKFTADNLRHGISLEVDFPDGRILLFEK
jgi:beta-galactosidase